MKGMAQRWGVASIAAVGLALVAGGASAADVTDNDRLFRNFTRETATVSEGQVRVEVRGLKEQDEGNARLDAIGLRLRSIYPGRTPDTVSAGIVDLVTSYGFAKNTELGFVLPGVIQSVRFADDTHENHADIGDLLLYTKFKRAVASHCDVGAGFELSTPTGAKENGLGTGELGFNPVVSTRYQRGLFATGLNAGYQMYTGPAVGVFNYGADVILRANETYAFRTEISGRVFSDGGTRFHDLTVLPGIDVNLANNLTIRPTGMAGATGSALDWGIGLGVATTF